MDKISKRNIAFIKKGCAVLAAVITIAICILPMSALPLWNGERPDHRNQYELMAEAILEGRVDFAYGDEGELAKLENPYDPVERKESGVIYHWDHAFYNGHYYMYFGVVPVFLVFLPYRIVTGHALTTFHGTQIFTAVFIVGIFFLFWLLAKLFFTKLPFIVYLFLSAAFSVMSVWYAVAEPALYCTAITAAIALEVWSLYFFIRAVYQEETENRQIIFAAVGALLGALVFGCRPPIALANVLVIPLLVVFLQKRTITRQLIGKLVMAATPYAVVALGLMAYNYTRFDSPFEFGQAYQLTSADQSNYGGALDAAQFLRVINGIGSNFFAFNNIKESFPYLQTSSVFFNFPIVMLSLIAIFPLVYQQAKEAKILPFLLTLLLTTLVITAIDVLWSPYLLERYRMDIYFLLGIGCFLLYGLWYSSSESKRGLSVLLVMFAIIIIISSFLLCLRRVDSYYPEKVMLIAKILGIL